MKLWHNISLGRYYRVSSPIHDLDPRVKLVACVIVMITMMLIDSWIAIAVWSILLIAAVVMARIPLQLFVRNLRAFLWLFSITIVLHGFTNSTTPHFKMWGFSVSLPGLIVGGQYAAKLMLLIVIASLLSFTALPIDLTDGLARLLKLFKRLKFPVHEFAFMVALALRFVPTIIDEAQRIQKAQISRGARFDGGLLRRVQALIPMLIPLFVATFNRADDLAIAMEARCYHGGEGRVAYRELVLSSNDYVVMALTIGISVLTIWFGSLMDF